MGRQNFHQYMHPFDCSLEFKAVSSDAMNPQLLGFPNSVKFHQHKMEFPSLHVYVVFLLRKLSCQQLQHGYISRHIKV